MNVIIVCGGTGGHLFPGMAIGEELLKRKHQVLLVVSKKEIDQKALRGAHGFLVQTLPAVGWRGLRPDRAFRFCLMMGNAWLHSRQIFRNFHPDVLVGMGGFSSVAPLFLARVRKIPTLIHESNTIAGKANRLTSRFVSVVAIGFESARKQFPRSKKIVFTGTPVRVALRQKVDADEVRRELNFTADLPTVLVMGGSQGASGINRIVSEVVSRISHPVQWLHLTGAEEETKVREFYARAGKKAYVQAFCHQMERFYAIADLIIARAGAASLAEIAQWSLPSILIPYPYAAERHQSLNADEFVKKGAAVMFEEAECSPERLVSEVQDLLTNLERRRKMSEATKQLRLDAAHETIAEMIEQMGVKSTC